MPRLTHDDNGKFMRRDCDRTNNEPMQKCEKLTKIGAEGRILPEGISCSVACDGKLLIVWHPKDIKVLTEELPSSPEGVDQG